MRLRHLSVLLVLIVAGLALDGFWLEPSSIKLARHDIALGAPALKGLHIAVISDLHAGAPYIDAAKIDRVVAMTNAAKPDLILLAGDYAGHVHVISHPLPIRTIVDHLRPLFAPLGVFAVIGNHDRKVEGARYVATALRDAGIPVLENQHVTLKGRHGDFILVGLGDADTRASRPDVALAGVPKAGPALCFTHSPDIFPYLPATCGLTIAGHTHGGQVSLPLIGPLILPSHYWRRYAAGLIREEGKTYFVSTGIGTSIIPVRLGVPPEISFLTLQ